jgi:hypothetical protein
MRTLRLLAVMIALPGTGCSWIGMTRPPPPPVDPAPPVACTTSRLAPALDTAAAVLLGVPGLVTTVYGIAVPTCTGSGLDCMLEPQSGGDKAAIIAVGLSALGLGVLETISAVNGYGWASRCEDLREAQLSCLSGVEPSCTSLRTVPRLDEGKATGEACTLDAECRTVDACISGHCQRRAPGAPSP